MFQFKFPASFQQPRSRALHRSVLLGRAAAFAYKKYDGLEDSARVSYSCGKGRYRSEEPTIRSTHIRMGR
jgi:hypothetical protein